MSDLTPSWVWLKENIWYSIQSTATCAYWNHLAGTARADPMEREPIHWLIIIFPPQTLAMWQGMSHFQTHPPMLLVGGVEHFFMTFHILGISSSRIIPTDFHIFRRGWNHQPGWLFFGLALVQIASNSLAYDFLILEWSRQKPSPLHIYHPQSWLAWDGDYGIGFTTYRRLRRLEV